MDDLDKLSTEELIQLAQGFKKSPESDDNIPKTKKKYPAFDPVGKTLDALGRFDITESVPAFGSSMLNTLTAGFAPKIEAAIAAPIAKIAFNHLKDLPLSDIYGQLRDLKRQEMNKVAKAHPVASILGDVAASAALPIAKTNLGNIALNAAYGGAYGLGTQDKGEALQLNDQDLVSGLSGAAIGGGTTWLLNKLLTSAFKPKIKPIEKTDNVAPNTDGNIFTEKFNESFRPKLESIPKDYTERYERAKKFDTGLTKGQLTRDPNDVFVETEMQMNRKGQENYHNLQNFQKEQNKRFSEAATNLIAQGKELGDPGMALEAAIESLKKRREKEFAPAVKLYDLAKKIPAYTTPESLKHIPTKIAKIIKEKENIHRVNSPEVYKEISGLKETLGLPLKTEPVSPELKILYETIGNPPSKPTVPLQKLTEGKQDFNAAITQNRSKGESRTARKLSLAVDILKDEIDKLGTKAAGYGKEYLDTVAMADKIYAKGKQKWAVNDKKKQAGKAKMEKLLEELPDGEARTPAQNLDILLGGSTGKITKASYQALTQLKKVANPVEWSNIRQEALHKVLQNAITVDGQFPKVDRLISDINHFLKSDVSKLILTQNERGTLESYVQHAKDLYIKDKNPMNFSGSGNVALSFMHNLAKRVPVFNYAYKGVVNAWQEKTVNFADKAAIESLLKPTIKPGVPKGIEKISRALMTIVTPESPNRSRIGELELPNQNDPLDDLSTEDLIKMAERLKANAN